MPKKHAASDNVDGGAGIALLHGLPELLPKLVPSGHRLMFSEASNLTRQMTQDSKLPIAIRITPRAGNNVLDNFTKLSAVFTVRIENGVRYTDMVPDSTESGDSAAQTQFLASIKSVYMFAESGIQATMFAAMLGRCTALCRLKVVSCSLGDDGVALLSRVLPFCSSLTHLDLTNNNMSEEGTERLAEVLASYPSLVLLNLSNNQIWDEGAEKFAEKIGPCTLLAELDLSENEIGFAGVQSLSAALSRLPSLSQLILSENPIGCVGAGYLAAGLWQCPCLANLEVVHSNIGDDGAECLVEARQKLTQLTYLDLALNPISEEVVAAFPSPGILF